MQRLSRRFSGFVFLYMAAAQIFFVLSFNLGLFFADLFSSAATLYLFLFPFVIYLPPVIFIAVRRYPFSGVLRLNTFSAKQLFFCVVVSIFLYLLFSVLRGVLNNFISLVFMNGFPFAVFYGRDMHIWPAILTSCLLPAILYELSFRGAVQSGLYGVRPLKACLVMGALFALMQTSVTDFLPYAIVGFTLSFISVRTGSIIPGMITALLFYLLRTINLDGLIYFGLLSPLGIDQGLSAAIIAAVSAVVLGLLLKAMPNTGASSRPITVDRSKSLLQRLMALRSRLQLSWLTDPDAPCAAPSSPGAAPIPAETELKVYPDGSARQNKNTGFVIGAIMLAAVALIFFGLEIYFAVANAGIL